MAPKPDNTSVWMACARYRKAETPDAGTETGFRASQWKVCREMRARMSGGKGWLWFYREVECGRRRACR